VLVGSVWSADNDYGYPIENPLATITIGTPQEYQMELDAPKKYKLFKLKIFKDRVTPKYFCLLLS
jgi:hypothetical protein